MGSLIEAARGCRMRLLFGTPFISGKDSLNNDISAQMEHVMPPTDLLISAIGLIDDIRQAVKWT